MKMRSSRREDVPVIIAVQSESGQRVQEQFLPSETLFNVISETIGIPATRRGQDIVCLYMRRELVGEEILKTTTLKSLGLTSGSAMLRVLVRNADALKTQAHVENLKLKKPEAPSKTGEVVADVKQNVSKFGKSLKKMVSGVFDSVTASSSESKPAAEQKASLRKEKPQTLGSKPQVRDEPKSVHHVQPDPQSTGPNECLDINWLGERDALVFNFEDMMKCRTSGKQEDLTDDFFEHTHDDVLLIYSDLKQKVKDMENRPLETAALREKRMTQSRYSKTVLRISFPADGLLIQATFAPADSVKTVINFVKNYLREPGQEFYLYTTPPKQLLSPQDTLIQKQLVPAALIHFGQSDANKAVLKPQLRSQITSSYAIAMATANLRREISERKQSESEILVEDDMAVAGAAAGPINDVTDGQDKKVPKWFKKQ